MTGECNTKKWILGSIAVFVFTMAFDWLVNGKLLMDTYTATAHLWRPMEEIQKMFPICLAKHAALAIIFAGAYACWRKKITVGAVGSSECPYRKSMGFGLWVGLMLGINAASAYMYIAIPSSLALAWLATETVKWALAGAVLSALYSRCNSTPTTVA